MADRISELRSKAVDIVNEKKMLFNQTDSLSFDIGIIEELAAGISDEDVLKSIDTHATIVDAELKKKSDELAENDEKRSEKISETDLYIESLEKNLSKIERMKNLSDLHVGDKHLGDVKRRLSELQEIRELLDEEGKVSLQKENNIGVENTVSQILDKPGVDIETVKEMSSEFPLSFPLLIETRESWHKDSDGTDIYDTPNETGEKLDVNQGKVDGFLGTCGIVSCVNVLRMAGAYEVTEEQVLNVAIKNGLCLKSFASRYSKGGTSAKQRMKLLNKMGLESELKDCNINEIALNVANGHGVIISVYASRLWWPTPTDPNATHAVTVTSVKKNRYGDIIGFYICDSGRHSDSDKSQYYSADDLEFALTGRKMNVTKNVIR